MPVQGAAWRAEDGFAAELEGQRVSTPPCVQASMRALGTARVLSNSRGCCARRQVEHTVEENVLELAAQRAAAMDMGAAAPSRGSSAEAALTVGNVAALLSAGWSTTGGGGGG